MDREKERERILKEYRKLSLRELLELRFYGSYTLGAIEKIIFEKVIFEKEKEERK